MTNTSQRTSTPEQFGAHQQGQPDAPEETNKKPGHDGQPAPGDRGVEIPKHRQDGGPDKKDVEPGSDADSTDASLGVKSAD